MLLKLTLLSTFFLTCDPNIVSINVYFGWYCNPYFVNGLLREFDIEDLSPCCHLTFFVVTKRVILRQKDSQRRVITFRDEGNGFEVVLRLLRSLLSLYRERETSLSIDVKVDR